MLLKKYHKNTLHRINSLELNCYFSNISYILNKRLKCQIQMIDVN